MSGGTTRRPDPRPPLLPVRRGCKPGGVSVVRWLALVLGLGLLVLGGTSVVYTLVLPRAHPSRLANVVLHGLHGLSKWAADRVEDYGAKDRIMAFAGPVALLGLFGTWLGTFYVGYSLILWPLVAGSGSGSGAAAGLPAAFKAAGSALFTLGLAGTPGGPAVAVCYGAAATGLIAVALEIAYLPTIYSAFNRRETLVTLLQSRAGAPAWGPEILARHQLVGITGNLPTFYGAWEQWAAELAETHTTYPVLVLFRSPNELRSWIVALLSVLDSAALYQALCPVAAPSESRLCLRMGFVCLREIAPTWGFEADPDPMPDAPIELTYEDFLEGVARLEEAGVDLERSPEEAWPHFRGWRVNYEASAYFLADLTSAVPAPWSGPRRRLAPISPVRPLDRTPDDPQATRSAKGRWAGPLR